ARKCDREHRFPTCAAADFGLFPLPAYKHWHSTDGLEVNYGLQKAATASVQLGRGAGTTMSLSLTQFLLLTQ
ncbi:hypothetical protein HPB47_005946, partial [Ixodes persulcatus]